MALLFPKQSFTQTEVEFENPYTDFSVDNLGNLYTVSDNSLLTKLVENDEFEVEQYDYSNRSLGNISSFDVSNPLRIIVNHQDFSTLVLLDVTLRETARIYLPDLQIFSNPVAYCLANDNTVWLYDDVNQQLIRVNEQGEVLFRSQNFVQDVGFSPQITALQSNVEYVVAHDVNRGFLVFDQFGAFIKLISINDISHFQLNRNSLYYSVGKTVFASKLQVYSNDKVADLPETASKFVIQQNRLFFMNFLGVGEMSLMPENQRR